MIPHCPIIFGEMLIETLCQLLSWMEDPSVSCEHVLFSLVDNKVVWPMVRQDKFRQYNQTEDRDEEGQSQSSCLAVAEETRHVKNEVTSHEPCDKA